MVRRLYSNENFPLPVVNGLRGFGYDVLTTQEVGNQGLDDEDVLCFARTPGRAVLTLNRKDFIALHKEDCNHFGIVVCTVDLDFCRQARNIDQGIRDASNMLRKLLRVNIGNAVLYTC